jgi:hypothetical protein
VVPAGNARHVDAPAGMEVVGVETVEDALQSLL